MEQQIYDITNIIRHRHGKDKLDWEESVSNVAFLHSKDMEENNYFSHYSLNGDGLKERLEAGEVFILQLEKILLLNIQMHQRRWKGG